MQVSIISVDATTDRSRESVITGNRAPRWRPPRKCMNYVLSLARTPPWQPGGRLEGPEQHPDPLTRGEYIVHAEMCGLCPHADQSHGIYRGDDFHLAGGMRVGAYPQGVFVGRNLTGDIETGLGRWSEAETATAIREGRARDRVLNIWGAMDVPPSPHGRGRPAIAKYLKALPPVRNAIPEPLHYGTLETLAVKSTRALDVPWVGRRRGLRVRRRRAHRRHRRETQRHMLGAAAVNHWASVITRCTIVAAALNSIQTNT
jgi:hypothetical protein